MKIHGDLKGNYMLGVVVHASNPSTRETDTTRSLHVVCKTGLHSESQIRQSYVQRSCIRNNDKKETNTKVNLTFNSHPAHIPNHHYSVQQPEDRALSFPAE